MKLSRDRILTLTAGGAAVAIALAAVGARADIEPWMQTAVSGSAIETALYRLLDRPGVRILYPRPPAEARAELDKLVTADAAQVQLYTLRAHVEEQALDFTGAERDWKASVEHAEDKSAAQFELADFYHRRNQGEQEIAALEAAASAAPKPTDVFVPANNQRAWTAFPRALDVAHEQALGDDATMAIYRAWVARYPAEPSIRSQFVSTLLHMHRFDEAQRAIDNYKTAFPQDNVFPIKAAALLAFDRGTPDATSQAMGMFEKGYQPLWSADLIGSYFELLDATHTRHTMLMAARADLVRNPDDLVAATKLFHTYQQQGRADLAANVVAQYDASKVTRRIAWTPDELYTFAALLDRAAQYAEAARYYYALAASPGDLATTHQSAAETGLTGLTRILLTAPDQPVAFGSGNLSMYRDLATIDSGPGYLNGILSLWLNSQDPAGEFHSEEQKATPYFHRQKAAELLKLIDERFAASPARPELHAALIQAYLSYGQDAAVREAGERFLADFPHAPQRLQIALEVADVDARANNTQAEFALYDKLLAELSAPLQGMALSAAATPIQSAPVLPREAEDAAAAEPPQAAPATQDAAGLLEQSLSLPVAQPSTAVAAQGYRQVLDRYMGRLVATNQPLAALALLRRELDRNPNDPLFYERLAAFLEQNDLSAQQEEVYRNALARFNDTSFYDKLARLYVRQKRQQEFDALTRKVVDMFQGTELERYFANVTHTWPEEYLQLNLYAHRRFPHDLDFTRNLLTAYQSKGTFNAAAYQGLLREHWHEAPDLQTAFFYSLSSGGRLAAELAILEKLAPSAREQEGNPAASQEIAEIHVWQSHFEQSAPLLGQLATAYPANPEIGEQAASVFRSLAYFDPTQIGRAVKIQQQLAEADPRNIDRLASIGDTYADSTASSLNLDTGRQLADASPYWRRMTRVHPGVADGYLQSATVFWDYFQFDAALNQIQAARTHFGDAVLFGYQAGAIYEGKRDYARAIAEYVGAATAAASDASAQSRLVELAQLPGLASIVDKATESAVGNKPTVSVLNLRAEILTALHQQQNLEAVVDSAIARATTVADAANLASFSQAHQLPAAYRTALEREITITNDPVQRIQLQYELVRAWQDGGDVAAAQRIVEAVYRDRSNATIVGVVRSTTDFYWNNKQPQRAIATLLQASQAANAGLSRQFLLEAIDKSNQSSDFAGARSLLKPLLTADPFNAQYLKMQAESFSLARDNAGLRDFYLATLGALRSASLPTLEKRDKIALVRQGLIPALTDLKDYSGAVDQHLALISAFPEDADILEAAASYARRYSVEPRLVAFLNKAVADSPQDSRFAIDLGRVDVQFEDYAGALAAYSRAIAIRNDRPDLYIARADLEEHQQAFDAVCSDYDRLYLLSYKDPQWMEKEALARARQGRPELAVKALQSAWLEGHTPKPSDYFRVAEQLMQWNMLAEADTFATQGIKLAGNDLLTDRSTQDGAILYARLLARERKSAEGMAFFTQALQASMTSPSSPSIIVKQIETTGVASVTDAQWRAHLIQAGQRQARETYARAMLEIAKVAGEFDTPEEKLAFAGLLDSKRNTASMQDIADLWIPAASAAGLSDREAAWRRDVLLDGGKLAPSQLMPFRELEEAHMQYRALAETLDLYVRRIPEVERHNVLSMVATEWRNAGDRQREIADLRTLVVNQRDVQHQQRLFQLYLRGNPEALLQLVSMDAPIADAALNYVVANGTQPQAYDALGRSASVRPAVWNSSARALAGLYYGDISPSTDSAFQSALANVAVGQRLQAKPDQSRQIVGAPWFYYGARYGYFLTLTASPAYDPEDYLAAPLELSSSDPASYNSLADAYIDAHKVDAALAEYRHLVELNPSDPLPHMSMAEALWSGARRPAAIAHWNQALIKLRAMVELRAVPESFWTSFERIANDTSTNKVGPQLKPRMELLLAAYLRKNGNYRSTELLRSGYIALAGQNQTDAENWILMLIATMPQNQQLEALSALNEGAVFPRAQTDAIYSAEITLAEAEAKSVVNPAQNTYPANRLREIQTRYVQWLLDYNRNAEARRIFDSIEPNQRQTQPLQIAAIRLAAREAGVPLLLASYESDPVLAPSLQTLAQAANTLRLEKDNQNSRLILEYIFTQKLRTQSLSPSDYLGLAAARIATDDMPGALALLQRLTMQGDLYQNLDSASSLLVQTGHPAEALPILQKLAAGVPWRADYRLRLGQVQAALKQASDAGPTLTSLAGNAQAQYAIRAASAGLLHGASATSFNSAELRLLASNAATAQQATQPYFVYAHILAATGQSAAQRPPLLRAAIEFAPISMLDWLRLKLFLAEVTQSQFEQASTAIAPLVQKGMFASLKDEVSQPMDVAVTTDQAEEESGTTTDVAAAESSTPTIDAYSVPAAIPARKDRRAVFLALATVDEHLDNLPQAVNDLKSALLLSDTPVQKTSLQVHIRSLQRRIDIAQENQARRPVFQESIEQSVRVRPRKTLTAARTRP